MKKTSAAVTIIIILLLATFTPTFAETAPTPVEIDQAKFAQDVEQLGLEKVLLAAFKSGASAEELKQVAMAVGITEQRFEIAMGRVHLILAEEEKIAGTQKPKADELESVDVPPPPSSLATGREVPRNTSAHEFVK